MSQQKPHTEMTAVELAAELDTFLRYNYRSLDAEVQFLLYAVTAVLKRPPAKPDAPMAISDLLHKGLLSHGEIKNILSDLGIDASFEEIGQLLEVKTSSGNLPLKPLLAGDLNDLLLGRKEVHHLDPKALERSDLPPEVVDVLRTSGLTVSALVGRLKAYQDGVDSQDSGPKHPMTEEVTSVQSKPSDPNDLGKLEL